MSHLLKKKEKNIHIPIRKTASPKTSLLKKEDIFNHVAQLETDIKINTVNMVDVNFTPPTYQPPMITIDAPQFSRELPVFALFEPKLETPDKLKKSKYDAAYVTVALSVDEHGNVDDVFVLDANPKGYLEKIAINQAKKFIFSPRKVDGTPVPSLVKHTWYYFKGNL